MGKRDSLSVTLRDHLETVIASNAAQAERDRISARDFEDVRHRAHEDAHILAAKNLDDRLEKLNELKAMAADSARLFSTRAEVTSEIKRIDAEIRVLALWRAEMAGKASQSSVYIAYLLSILGLLLALARWWKG